MPFDWNSATVGHFVDLQRGNTYKSTLLDTPGPLLLGLASIARDGGFRSEKLRTYGGESAAKLLVYPGDIYVSLKDVTQSGDLLGSVARVPSFIPVGRMTQDTVKLVFKNELIDHSYLYWILRTPEYREYCRARGMGTTNLSLSRDDFLLFPVPEPTPVRLSIRSTLDAVEGKITLNRELNQTLETMAQAIFTSWFVDFEPVKAKIAAKAEGCDPLRAAMSVISGKPDAELNALPPEQYEQLAATAVLFPDEMEESELGEIPRGWIAEPLSKMIRLIGGGTPKRSESAYWGGDVLWYSVKDAPCDGDVWAVDTEEKITDIGLQKSSTKLLPVGTTIISARGTVGKLAMVGKEMAMNQSCYGVIGVEGIGSCFNYFNLKETVEALKRNTHGAVFDTITQATFETVTCVRPLNEQHQAFEEHVRPLLDEIRSRVIQNRTLATLRDTLLPKLLCGELTVEAIAEHAGIA